MTFPRPGNFPYKEVFYFDGEIALIKGRYKDSDRDSIGMRWMVGESDLGYPSTFGNAMWMVVPDKLAQYRCQNSMRFFETSNETLGVTSCNTLQATDLSWNFRRCHYVPAISSSNLNQFRHLYILEGIFRDLEKQRKFVTDFQEFMDALDFIRAG